MTNNRRHESPDELQHVIARGVFGDRLVPGSDWSAELYNAIAREAHERGWSVWSLCIMETHYHLLVSTPDASLATGLQRAHAAHAIRRNGHNTRRRGAVFGRRYDSFPISDGRHLQNALRYIPRNPVKAGLCEDPSEWAWGTFRAIAGLEPCPRWVPKSRIFRALEGDFSDPAEPWFGERQYLQMCRSIVETPDPTLHKGDRTRYDAECMRDDGASVREIARTLDITVRHARRLCSHAGAIQVHS